MIIGLSVYIMHASLGYVCNLLYYRYAVRTKLYGVRSKISCDMSACAQGIILLCRLVGS